MITHAAPRGGRPTGGPSRFLTEAGLTIRHPRPSPPEPLPPRSTHEHHPPRHPDPCAPARTHAQANELLRRPFAPGAIGFRAMSKMPLGNDPYGGAQVAAYLAAQSVVQRLNCVVPGRWRQEFAPAPPELPPPARPRARQLYLACRLTLTLPRRPRAAPTSRPSTRTSARWTPARSPG